ncbi:MAG: SDR family NAD(P)-dependent oxidoreductase, partial [Cyclobacteriaceae bacterium]
MAKKYLIAGGSSGIGLELVKNLAGQGNEITVLSRTKDSLDGLENVTHQEHDFLDDAPPKLEMDQIDGLAYCPGTINLKPFRSLKTKDFEYDFRINVLGAI